MRNMWDVDQVHTKGLDIQCSVRVQQVLRFSDGSYLEDMDHWWLSGIYRSVI